MADTLVKRIDSAHMARMYEKALETTDADFLSSTTDITIEQVRRLRLGDEETERQPPKAQNKPPQPPKPKSMPMFSLNSFDFLLDDGDAESWLVASPYDEERLANLKSAPIFDAKRDAVGSPVESTVSSEISRSNCLTPASILETKSQKLKKEDAMDALNVTRPKSVEPRLSRCGSGDFDHKQKDIRNLPRSIGCIKHTPAPVFDKASNLPTVIRKSEPASLMGIDRSEDEEKKPKKTLGTRLKGRISSLGQKETSKIGTSLSKSRPKTVGPVPRTRLSATSPTPARPKSSMGRTRVITHDDTVSSLRKKDSTTRPRRSNSSLARPASALGTVKEEGSEKKNLLRFRKLASPGPIRRPQSALGRPSLENKPTTKRTTVRSKIASPAPRPKTSLGKPKTESSILRSSGMSRIASPPQSTVRSTRTSNLDKKEDKTILGLRKPSSSVPPRSTISTRLPKESKIGRLTTNKKKSKNPE